MSHITLPAHLKSAFATLPSGPVVVAYSGGADSHALLHALARNAQARTRDLRALHIDHGLHADSTRWAEHCREAAAALEVPFESIRVDVENDRGKGIEEAARTARMNAFAAHLQDGEILALAQHRDDQAETVLLKLLRGAGPQGLGGMRTLRPFARGRLWRPLLDLPRSDLLDYARTNALRWIDDPSNADTRLRRNFLRSEILPRLQQRWPDAHAALAHSATWARAASDFIGTETRKALARLQGLDPATLNWQRWLELPDALRDPVLRAWLRDLELDEPAHFHVAELERQLAESAHDRSPCVRFADTELRRYRDLMYAMRSLSAVPAQWQADWDGTPLILPDRSKLESGSGTRFVESVQVRYRRGGERIKPEGAAYTRDLRVLLQEAGIPPWLRDYLPLIYAKNELIGVADLYLSEAGESLCRESNTQILWIQK